MKLSNIVLLGLGGAGAWWLWRNRNMLPEPVMGTPGVDPAMAESFMRCTTAPGCSDAEYQNLRAYMFNLMNAPGLRQDQIEWVADRINELDMAHAQMRT